MAGDLHQADGRAEGGCMKPGQAQRCIDAMKALYAPPMSADELAHYNTLRAAEMARAESRRRGEPQMELISE